MVRENKHRQKRNGNVIFYKREDTNNVLKDRENLEKLMNTAKLELQMLSVVRLVKYDTKNPDL